MELIRVCEKMMKNSKCSVPPSLPTDLMKEILLRLPVRSLLRFKCVCKSWFSLISDPQFAESHFDMALAPTCRLLVHSKSHFTVNCNSLDIDAPLHSNSDELVSEIPLPSPLPFPEEVYFTRFVVSCRGLVLLTCKCVVNHKYFSEFVVWNPSTNFRKRIPRTMTEDLIGFGYDSSTDDYLLVNVSKIGFKFTNVEWFSFRTNSWSRMQLDVVHCRGFGPYGVFLNDALHWLVTTCDNWMFKPSDRRVLIMVFDMRERRMSEMLLPHDLATTLKKVNNIATRPKFNNIVACLKLMAGCLCLYLVGEGGGISIWTMKQYNVQTSWIKSFVMTSNCDPLLSRFDPICFTRDGHILGSNAKTLVKVTDKGELLEHHTPELNMVDESGVEFCAYRESLFAITPSGIEKTIES